MHRSSGELVTSLAGWPGQGSRTVRTGKSDWMIWCSCMMEKGFWSHYAPGAVVTRMAVVASFAVTMTGVTSPRLRRV